MINITYNPKFDIYMAFNTKIETVEFTYKVKGGERSFREQLPVKEFLAVAKTAHEATILANIKLKRTA